MHSYGFKVVPESSRVKKGVPVAVAGQIMVDIQNILTDIGCFVVRMELRIQNAIPEELKEKFYLNIGDTDSGIGSGPSEGNEDALAYSMENLFSMLDYLGTGAVGNWLEETFQDDESRCKIVQDVLDLDKHLTKYKLIYTDGEKEREFCGLNREKVSEYLNIDPESNISAALGIITRDPEKQNHWNISNDGILVPITFDKNIASSDIPSFSKEGAVIVIGNVKRDEEGHITSIDKINGCFSFPEIKFHRIISRDGDRILLNPIAAKPSYDEDIGKWRLKYDELGINITKDSWDECVASFHDYVIFLFKNYVDVPDTFQGEEKEIREFLASLLPA